MESWGYKKRTTGLKHPWQRRFFRLDEGTTEMIYYKAPADLASRGVIDALSLTRMAPTDDSVKNERDPAVKEFGDFALDLHTKDRVYHLIFESEEDRDGWVLALWKATDQAQCKLSPSLANLAGIRAASEVRLQRAAASAPAPEFLPMPSSISATAPAAASSAGSNPFKGARVDPDREGTEGANEGGGGGGGGGSRPGASSAAQPKSPPGIEMKSLRGGLGRGGGSIGGGPTRGGGISSRGGAGSRGGGRGGRPPGPAAARGAARGRGRGGGGVASRGRGGASANPLQARLLGEGSSEEDDSDDSDSEGDSDGSEEEEEGDEKGGSKCCAIS